MQRCGERGLRSGALYDALHFVAAARQEADILLTFNTRHFLPSGPMKGPELSPHLIPQVFLIEGPNVQTGRMLGMPQSNSWRNLLRPRS